MKSQYIGFLTIQHQIFGVCPKCRDLFRLSDCRIYSTKKPAKSWMDDLGAANDKLARREERLDEREEAIREQARAKGRKAASRMARKIDPVFTPRHLNPDDAKVLFHPVDYVVFRGMTSGNTIREVIMLDRETTSKTHRQVQRSIERAIDRGNYEWATLRVQDDGSIKEE